MFTSTAKEKTMLNYENTARGIVLEENVFLASVRVSMYDPEKKDRAASIELADAKNASRREMARDSKRGRACCPPGLPNLTLIRSRI